METAANAQPGASDAATTCVDSANLPSQSAVADSAMANPPVVARVAGEAAPVSVATKTTSLVSKYASLLGQKLGATTAYGAQLLRSSPHVLDELKDHLIAELEELRTLLPAVVKTAETDGAAVATEMKSVEQTVSQVEAEVKQDAPSVEVQIVEAEQVAQSVLQTMEQIEGAK